MLRLHLVALPNWPKLKLSERTSLEIWQSWTKSKEPLLLETSTPHQERELNSWEPNSLELSEQDSQLIKKPSKFSKFKKENKTSHSESLVLKLEWCLDYLNFNILSIIGSAYFFTFFINLFQFLKFIWFDKKFNLTIKKYGKYLQIRRGSGQSI